MPGCGYLLVIVIDLTVVGGAENGVGRSCRLAALLVLALEVENGPNTMTSMAVGRSGSVPGAGRAGKISASTGREAVPNKRT